MTATYNEAMALDPMHLFIPYTPTRCFRLARDANCMVFFIIYNIKTIAIDYHMYLLLLLCKAKKCVSAKVVLLYAYVQKEEPRLLRHPHFCNETKERRWRS